MGARCFLLYLIGQYCNAIICSRQLQQMTFSDAFFLGAFRVNSDNNIAGPCYLGPEKYKTLTKLIVHDCTVNYQKYTELLKKPDSFQLLQTSK